MKAALSLRGGAIRGPVGLSVKDQILQILEWLKDRNRSPVSDRTIKRALSELRRENSCQIEPTNAPKKTQPDTPETYLPEPEERAAIEKVLERKIAPTPRLKVDNNVISIDHPNVLVGHMLVQNALGSLDDGFTNGLLTQLAQATSGGPKVNEADLNFMLSFIKGIEPRDQIESTLAAHMAVGNMALIKFAAVLSTEHGLHYWRPSAR